MNITVGKTTFGRNNWPGFGALLAGLTAVGILAGVGIWQATESDSKSTASPPVAARAVDFPSPAFTPTYVYLVESQAQADAIYQASFETQMSAEASGTFNHSIRVIDLSTPAGQDEYRLMSAELQQVQLENPGYDAGLVQIIDMTAPALTAIGSSSAARPVAQEASPPAYPTFFYVVDSKESGDQVLQAEFLAEQESALNGLGRDYHHTVIIDVSTLAGQQLLNTVSGELFEMWENPNVDQPLVQIIDVRE